MNRVDFVPRVAMASGLRTLSPLSDTSITPVASKHFALGGNKNSDVPPEFADALGLSA